MNNTPIHIVDGVDLAALVPHFWRALGQHPLADKRQALRAPPTVAWIRLQHRGRLRDIEPRYVRGLSWWRQHKVRMSVGAKAPLADVMELLLHELTHNMRPALDKHSLDFRRLLADTANSLWGLGVKDYPTRNQYSVDDVLARQLAIALGSEWKPTRRTPTLKAIADEERPKVAASVTADGRLQYPRRVTEPAADIKPLRLSAFDLSKLNVDTRVRAFYGQRSFTYTKTAGGWKAGCSDPIASRLLADMADAVYVDA